MPREVIPLDRGLNDLPIARSGCAWTVVESHSTGRVSSHGFYNKVRPLPRQVHSENLNVEGNSQMKKKFPPGTLFLAQVKFKNSHPRYGPCLYSYHDDLAFFITREEAEAFLRINARQ